MKTKVVPPKTIIKDGKLLQLQKTYVLLDDEGEVIRHMPHQFPHSKLVQKYVEIYDLNTLPDALF